MQQSRCTLLLPPRPWNPIRAFCVAPYQFAPGPGRTAPHQREWLSQDVAAVYASDGGGIDRSRVEPARSAPLSGAAVATATDGLRKRRRWTIVEVGG